MRPFSRNAAPPEDGWFRIGEVPQQTPPRRRGQGRISLSSAQHNPDTVSLQPPAPKRSLVLASANETATRTLERIIDRRYGALALFVIALLVVLIAAGVSAALASELRASREQLASARVALIQGSGRSPHAAAPGFSNEGSNRKERGRGHRRA